MAPSLAPLEGAFIEAGKKHGVDPRFLAAVSMLETAGGTSSAFRRKRNAMGVSNSKGPISFGNHKDSIERMARVLASSKGPYAGKNTIAEIAGVYAPPGAGNDPKGTNGYWPTGVAKYFQMLGGNPKSRVK